MKLTIYIHTNHTVLNKCLEVFVKTHFQKTFEHITFKYINKDNIHSSESGYSSEINTFLKDSLKSMRIVHESLKLKETHKVWVIYVATTTLPTEGTNKLKKQCSLILFNDNPQQFRSRCQLFKGSLRCTQNREANLKSAKLLNEQMKTLLSRDPNFIKY